MSRNHRIAGLVDMKHRIDMQLALDEMRRLAETTGGWRWHLPYQAIVNWHQDSNVRHRFGEHVGGCKYCREAIETFAYGKENRS